MRTIDEINTGDKIWCIEREDGDPVEVSGFIFVAKNAECVIVSSDPVGYRGTISEYLIEESSENMGTDIYVFPVRDAFITRNAAEQAKEE